MQLPFNTYQVWLTFLLTWSQFLKLFQSSSSTNWWPRTSYILSICCWTPIFLSLIVDLLKRLTSACLPSHYPHYIQYELLKWQKYSDSSSLGHAFKEFQKNTHVQVMHFPLHPLRTMWNEHVQNCTTSSETQTQCISLDCDRMCQHGNASCQASLSN